MKPIGNSSKGLICKHLAYHLLNALISVEVDRGGYLVTDNDGALLAQQYPCYAVGLPLFLGEVGPVIFCGQIQTAISMPHRYVTARIHPAYDALEARIGDPIERVEISAHRATEHLEFLWDDGQSRPEFTEKNTGIVEAVSLTRPARELNQLEDGGRYQLAGLCPAYNGHLPTAFDSQISFVRGIP